MKKVLFSMAVLAAVSFVACNNAAKEENTEAAPADTVETLTVEAEGIVAVDSVAAPADSVAAPADSAATK